MSVKFHIFNRLFALLPFSVPQILFCFDKKCGLILKWMKYICLFFFCANWSPRIVLFLIALSLNWLNNGLMMSAGSSNVTVYLKCDSVVFAYCALSNCTILVYVSAHCAFSSLSCIFLWLLIYGSFLFFPHWQNWISLIVTKLEFST